MLPKSKPEPQRSSRRRVAGRMAALIVSLACLAPPAMLSAAPADASDAELLARVARAIDSHVIPTLEVLKATSRDLTEAIEWHCESADIGSLKSIENAFAKTAKAWAAAEHLRFGPLRDAERVARFHFWPDPRGVTARQMRRVFQRHDPELLEPDTLQKQSVATLGLGAVEHYILFERQAFDQGPAARVDDYECLYARGVARLIDADAAHILAEWTKPGGWRDRLENPAPEADIFRSGKESAAQLVKSLLLGLQLLRDQRIVPLYELTKGDAKSARVPFQRLGLADETIRAALASLNRLNDTLALSDFARGRTAWVRAWTDQAFYAVVRTAADLDVPGRSTLEAGDFDLSNLRKLRFYTNGLRQVIARQTAPSAGLTIGFNELDGD